MNRRTQDAEFCGKVPLNQTNLIQPHGVLLVVNKADLTIIQVSENVSAVFGEAAVTLVNRPLPDYISLAQTKKLKERAAVETLERLPLTLSIKGNEFLSLIHTKQAYLIVELELPAAGQENQKFINIYQELKYVMATVDSATTTEEACSRAIKELKRLTSFDKIMIYQFDEEWNGTVIAEEAEEGMDKYLGLRFPASDVPKQARDLYLKNPYRFIPNAEYTPVKLYPLLNPVTNAFMDLSDTNLRSVAGVHIEYLKNMGVMASMSTRIIQDEELWGLIACHHRQPKYLSYEICFVFELVSNVISAKIASVQKADAASYNQELLKTYQRLLEAIYVRNDLNEALKKSGSELLDLLKADGAALIFNKQITLLGKTPTKDQVENLIFWLRSQEVTKLYHQPNLSQTYVDAESFTPIASGLLALPVQPEKGTYVLAFRPEAVQKIDWGGNPNEAITFEADKKNYHPRNSFQLWQETVRYRALPWKKEELEVAESLRNFLIEFTLNNA